jgi:hypothetical protein
MSAVILGSSQMALPCVSIIMIGRLEDVNVWHHPVTETMIVAIKQRP